MEMGTTPWKCYCHSNHITSQSDAEQCSYFHSHPVPMHTCTPPKILLESVYQQGSPNIYRRFCGWHG